MLVEGFVVERSDRRRCRDHDDGVGILLGIVFGGAVGDVGELLDVVFKRVHDELGEDAHVEAEEGDGYEDGPFAEGKDR